MDSKYLELVKTVQSVIVSNVQLNARIQALEAKNSELTQRLQLTEEKVKILSLSRNQSNEFEIVKKRSSSGHIESFKVRHKIDKSHQALQKVPIQVIGDKITKVYSRAQDLTHLKHRNIIRYRSAWIEIDSIEGQPPEPVMYILTDLCERHSLQHFIRQGKFDQSSRHHLFGQLVSALEYIHNEKITHGSLRVNSIYYIDHLQVRIGEFGLIPKNDPVYLQEQVDYLRSLVYDFGLTEADLLENFDVARKIDFYSLGIVYFYMCYPMKTPGFNDILHKIAYSPFSTPIQHITPQDAKVIKTLLNCFKSQSSVTKLLADCKNILESREMSSVSNDSNTKKAKMTK